MIRPIKRDRYNDFITWNGNCPISPADTAPFLLYVCCKKELTLDRISDIQSRVSSGEFPDFSSFNEPPLCGSYCFAPLLYLHISTGKPVLQERILSEITHKKLDKLADRRGNLSVI